MKEPILRGLSRRACESSELSDNGLYRSECRSGMSQMESDVQALPELKAKARERIAELTKEEKQQRVERVRLSKIYKGSIDSEESVEKVVEALREHLIKLLLENAKIILE